MANGDILIDSAVANSKGVAVFKGDKKLAEGIYFFVSPDKVLDCLIS